ncbi:MAG: hypothetical protein WCG09_00160 [Halobacteriota archaeon]
MNKLVSKCKLIEFPNVVAQRGNLTFVEENQDMPLGPKGVLHARRS